MQNRKSTNLLWLAIIFCLTLSCSIGPAAVQPTTAPVIQPTAVPPTAAPPTAVPPTAVPPSDTPVPTITPTPGPVIVDDDFSTDTGRFKCDKCVVSGGELTIGPFPLVDSYKPFSALCSDCGTVTNYKMSADIWYVEGNSNFGYGLVLRDNNKENIYLAVSSWLVYNVFSFDPSAGGGAGWKTLIGNWTKGGLVAGRGINSVEVVMQDSTLSITINGKLNRNIDLPSGSGQVGLYVSNWETGAGFDNFHFEELP
jgi:hypothetical protein